MMHHLVDRQSIEFKAPDQAAALRMQAALSDRFRDGMLLDRVFDRLDAGSQGSEPVLRLDRLIIDLGRIDGPDWLDQFAARLEERLTVELTARRMDAASVASAARAVTAPETQIAADGAGAAPHTDARDAVIYWVRTGRLPWWYSAVPDPGLMPALVAQLAPAAMTQVADVALASEDALMRLVAGLSPADFSEALAAHVEAETRAAAETTDAALAKSIAGTVTVTTAARAMIWSPLLRASFDKSTELSHSTLSRLWANALARPSLPALVAIPMHRRRAALMQIASLLPARWREPWVDATARAFASDSHIAEGGTASPNVKDAPEKATHGGPPDRVSPHPDAAARQTTQAETAAPKEAETETDMAVENAGIVLFHPFLSELFSRLELIEERQFISDEARARAIRLTASLAFGRQEPLEPQLTLAKVLCGWAPDALVLPEPIPERDREAAEALTQAVIDHWPAIRGSSAGALREGFLARAGRLSAVDDGWALTVERRAQDVLLAQLPWGIGLVSLPWTDALLHVNWTD